MPTNWCLLRLVNYCLLYIEMSYALLLNHVSVFYLLLLDRSRPRQRGWQDKEVLPAASVSDLCAVWVSQHARAAQHPVASGLDLPLPPQVLHARRGGSRLHAVGVLGNQMHQAPPRWHLDQGGRRGIQDARRVLLAQQE